MLYFTHCLLCAAIFSATKYLVTDGDASVLPLVRYICYATGGDTYVSTVIATLIVVHYNVCLLRLITCPWFHVNIQLEHV